MPDLNSDIKNLYHKLVSKYFSSKKDMNMKLKTGYYKIFLKQEKLIKKQFIKRVKVHIQIAKIKVRVKVQVKI